MGDMDADEVADLIAEFGNTVYVGEQTEDADTITAIIDEQSESIRRQVGSETLDGARGRPILLHMTAEDAANVPEGTLLIYRGQQFTQSVRKEVTAGNVTIMVAILAYSGGI